MTMLSELEKWRMDVVTEGDVEPHGHTAPEEDTEGDDDEDPEHPDTEGDDDEDHVTLNGLEMNPVTLNGLEMKEMLQPHHHAGDDVQAGVGGRVGGHAQDDEPPGHLVTLQAGEDSSVKCGMVAQKLKMMNRGAQDDDLWTMMMIYGPP